MIAISLPEIESMTTRKKTSRKVDEVHTDEGQGMGIHGAGNDLEPTHHDVGQAGLVSKVVYNSVYGVTFGVVFSSLLVAKLLIPKHGIVAKALHDGSAAARRAVRETHQQVEEVVEHTVEVFSDCEAEAEPQ